MHSYGFRRERLVFRLCALFFFLSISVALWIGDDSAQMAVLSALVAIAILATMVDLVGSRPALAFDRKGVTVRRPLGSVRFGWDRLRRVHIRNVEIETRFGLLPTHDEHWRRSGGIDFEVTKTSHGVLNLLLLLGRPSSTNEYLVITYSTPSGGERQAKLETSQIVLPHDGLEYLVKKMVAERDAALGEKGAALARLGVLDDDNTRTKLVGVQAERYRRLGLDTGEEPEDETPPTAAPAPYHPPRPGFGRRGA